MCKREDTRPNSHTPSYLCVIVRFKGPSWYRFLDLYICRVCQTPRHSSSHNVPKSHTSPLNPNSLLRLFIQPRVNVKYNTRLLSQPFRKSRSFVINTFLMGPLLQVRSVLPVTLPFLSSPLRLLFGLSSLLGLFLPVLNRDLITPSIPSPSPFQRIILVLMSILT